MSDRDRPHAYVLELACDACDQQPAYKHRMFIAPNAVLAWKDAHQSGWTHHGEALICPTCAHELGL